MLLLALVFTPFLAVGLPFLVAQRGRTAIALCAALAPALGLALLLSQATQVLDGLILSVNYPWIAQLGLNLSFRLDGLSFLFA